MQMAIQHHADAHRRPGGLDLAAGLLLLATVVLHVAAMAPEYFSVGGTAKSLMAQPDQAALYSVLAASWALALAIGLTGPARTPVAAALAVGVAAAELGFRVADLGDVFRYGTSTAGAGLWVMEAAWVVGACAAAVAVMAARSRHGRRPAPAGAGTGDVEPDVASPDVASPDVASPDVVSPDVASPDVVGAAAATREVAAADTAALATSGTAALATNDTAALATSGTAALAAPSAEDPHSAQERTAWTMLVVVLALLSAGAFLPSWDHYVGELTATGHRISFSLGNAFSGPWQQVIGTVMAAAAIAIVPIVAIRLRNRAVGAGLACGTLLVLATQFVAAIIQVDQSVTPADLGLSQSQAAQLGLEVGVKLTGWFTLDALAAYALFATIIVWATLRVVGDGARRRSTVPDWREDVISWGP